MKTGRFIDAEGVRAEIRATELRPSNEGFSVGPPSAEIKIRGEGRFTAATWLEFCERIDRAVEEVEGRR
jgi:hypothetical protein